MMFLSHMIEMTRLKVLVFGTNKIRKRTIELKEGTNLTIDVSWLKQFKKVVLEVV